MTIPFDHFAVFPKRCDRCGRRFIWEPYNTFYKEVGIEHYDLKCVKCRECVRRGNG